MSELNGSMIALTTILRQVPRRRPLGSRNLGTLLRDRWLELNERLHRHVAAQGFDDLRPALSVVFQHVQDEGSRLTEIAERAQLTKQTVVYLVNELESLRYVERVADAADGRAKLIRLSARGEAAGAAARRAAAEIEGEWAQLIGAQELRELRDH